jgi:hypothetical protein
MLSKIESNVLGDRKPIYNPTGVSGFTNQAKINTYMLPNVDTDYRDMGFKFSVGNDRRRQGRREKREDVLSKGS